MVYRQETTFHAFKSLKWNFIFRRTCFLDISELYFNSKTVGNSTVIESSKFEFSDFQNILKTKSDSLTRRKIIGLLRKNVFLRLWQNPVVIEWNGLSIRIPDVVWSQIRKKLWVIAVMAKPWCHRVKRNGFEFSFHRNINESWSDSQTRKKLAFGGYAKILMW